MPEAVSVSAPSATGLQASAAVTGSPAPGEQTASAVEAEWLGPSGRPEPEPEPLEAPPPLDVTRLKIGAGFMIAAFLVMLLPLLKPAAPHASDASVAQARVVKTPAPAPARPPAPAAPSVPQRQLAAAAAPKPAPVASKGKAKAKAKAKHTTYARK
jgi:hypothetical protein